MEPKCSLPHSQVSATCPYPEPDQSSPCLQSHFLKIYLNIILPSMPVYSMWPHSLRFPHQNPEYVFPRLHTCYMHRLSIFPDFITRIILLEQYRSLRSSICSFLHSPVTSSFLGPNILLSTPFSNTLSLRSSLSASDQISHPYKTTGKIRVLYILIFKFLDIKLEDISTINLQGIQTSEMGKKLF